MDKTAIDKERVIRTLEWMINTLKPQNPKTPKPRYSDDYNKYSVYFTNIFFSL